MGLLPINIAGSSPNWWANTNQAHKKLNAYVDVVADYGADPTGVASSSAAIQAAIDFVTGAANPATTTRYPTLGVYAPPGTFKLTTPLLIRSVQGFHLMGAGKWLTAFQGVAPMDHMLKIDGASQSTFEGFKLASTGSASSVIDKVLWLDWIPPTNRTTSHNTFRDITMQDGWWKTGIAIGINNSQDQVDTTNFFDVTVHGNWDYTDHGAVQTTHSQDGVLIGSGIFGNNLDHRFYGCFITAWKRGIHTWGGGGPMMFGGFMGASKIDCYNEGANSTWLIDGLRVEGSSQFYYGSGVTPENTIVTLRNIEWNAQQIDQGTWQFINNLKAGTLVLENIRVKSAPVITLPKITVNSGSHHSMLVVNGMGSQTPFDTMFDLQGSNSEAIVMGYFQNDATGTPVSRIPFRTKQGATSGGSQFHLGRSAILAEGASDSEAVLRGKITGESNNRFQDYVTGMRQWGSGSAAYDTNLYRQGANELRTDDKFLTVLGLGVGNSVAATTPGSVVRKMEVFDASGASLGFVPIYSAIT